MVKKTTTRRPAAQRTTKVIKKTRKVVKRSVPAAKSGPALAGISSAAVEKATGRTWDSWLQVLDRDGAAQMPHKAIAELLHTRHGVGDWWSQMVTVGYEQARGLREKHQTPKGYQVSGSKTVNVSLAMLYEAWADAALRKRWLPEADLVVRKATPQKSMRITWEASKGDKASSVEVNFYAKGDGKAMVQVGHTKIASAATGQKWKKFWGERLEKLKSMLER